MLQHFMLRVNHNETINMTHTFIIKYSILGIHFAECIINLKIKLSRTFEEYKLHSILMINNNNSNKDE